MNLNQKLNEFFFNLETAQLLQSLGRTRDQVLSEMNSLHFSDHLLTFYSSSRHLFDSVVLRLKLYAESNLPEDRVRQSLGVLNNSYVTSLLDYLYSTTSLSESPVVETTSNTSPVTAQPVAQVTTTVTTPVTTPVTAQTTTTEPVTTQPAADSDNENLVESESESEDEEDPFESFFGSCVEQTEEPTDIVKASDFYQAFTEWWQEQYEDQVPDKKELKTFLTDKLGKSKKSTWTNVVLTN